MSRSSSNIREIGVSSIRLNGCRIEDLPIAEAARAKEQIPAAFEAERQSKVAAVRARYPKQDVTYLIAVINECQNNIRRISIFRNEQRAKINEYTAATTMCKHRDNMITQLTEDDPDRKRKIRDLNKQFLPYNVEAMRQQITQFEEAVQRSDNVIEQENASIAEFSEVLALVKRRDMELCNLGE